MREHSLHIGIDGRLVRLKLGDLVGPLLRLRFHQVAAGHHLNIVNSSLC